ncbi:DUF4097 family beta strand repeat protein [bacterium]|nr:DUF4097 family beta strand repeat protein [bacterium]
MTITRPGIAVLLIAMTAAAFAGAEEVRKVVEEQYRIADGGEVKLTGNAGDVTIAGWDNEYIQLTMTKRAWGDTEAEAEDNLRDINVLVQEFRDRLVIRERSVSNDRHFTIFDLFDGDFWSEQRWRRRQVDYDLKVPRHTALTVSSDEGDVNISGIEAGITLSVDEGDADLSGIVADMLDVELDEGRVFLQDSKEAGHGHWSIETDEGRIHVQHIAVRELDLSSDEGDITVENAEMRKLWLTVDEGDIYVELHPADGSDYRLESDEGDIEIVLPAGPDIELRLRSEEGIIESDFTVTVRERDGGEMTETRLGNGGAYLKAAAEDGDILLLQRKR